VTDSPTSVTAHVRRDLSIDQRHALKTAATRLQTDFGEHFGVETIERFLHSSYDQFAGRATVPNFLPLLAERWARQRLTALARVEGKITDTIPTVLFLCTHNAGRSQMALGFFNHLGGGQAVASQALGAVRVREERRQVANGRRPDAPDRRRHRQRVLSGHQAWKAVNAISAQTLGEIGVDITDETPKLVDPQLVRDVDVVVTLGREAHLDPVTGTRFENWDTDEPSERGIDGIERMRLVRDDIATRVRELLTELTPPA
jgi:arsenate reductase